MSDPIVALVSTGISVAICASIALCCVYCKGCPFYRNRNRNVRTNPVGNVQYVVGQPNMAYYDQQGNPVILTPNLFAPQSPNPNAAYEPPPSYAYPQNQEHYQYQQPQLQPQPQQQQQQQQQQPQPKPE